LALNIIKIEAQESDLASWNIIAVKPRPLAGKWASLLAFEYRRRNNMKETDRYSGFALVDYIISNRLKAGLGYEIFFNNDPEGYGLEHRYYPELIYAMPLGGFNAVWRMRFQNTFKEWENPYWEHRNRLKISYSIKNSGLSPFVYIEAYNRLKEQFYDLNKMRYAGGCNYTAGHQQFDLYYMQEDYHSRDFRRHVIYLEYTYCF
jgi:hypothetical protein